MKLHSLPSSHKRVQRIGRGGKRGHTAGRGTKGQRSRSGHRIRPAERDLILRIPKARGFRNKPKSENTKVFNLEELAASLKLHGKAGTAVAVDKAFLKTAKLLGKTFTGTVKLLGDGAITMPITVSGIMVSKSAKLKIEKAGGKIEAEK
jgi:large subunit ribosomal protein L15